MSGQEQYRTHIPAPEMETVPGIGRVHRRPEGSALGEVREVNGREVFVYKENPLAYQETRQRTDRDLDWLVGVLRKLNPKTEITRDNAARVAAETVEAMVRVSAPLFEYIRAVWLTIDNPIRDLYRAIEEDAPWLLAGVNREHPGTPP